MYRYCFWLKANVDVEWCTLWLFNIAMENGPFIDGLPIKNGGSFHGYVSHNQMVDAYACDCGKLYCQAPSS